MLQVQNIEKYYGSKNNVTCALNRVSFDVEAKEFLAIMGASGSGKTTLLNCISTIDSISAGKILLDGVNIADLSEEELAGFRRKRLGFVFQDFNLLDTLTIEENIGLALSLNHTNPKTVQNLVQDVAQKLGITDIFDPDRSDFTPMTAGMDGLVLSKANHAARVVSDVEGCTAAAFTVMANAGAAPPPDEEVDFVLDRPFVFCITGDSGLPLFVGIVKSPA